MRIYEKEKQRALEAWQQHEQDKHEGCMRKKRQIARKIIIVACQRVFLFIAWTRHGIELIGENERPFWHY